MQESVLTHTSICLPFTGLNRLHLRCHTDQATSVEEGSTTEEGSIMEEGSTTTITAITMVTMALGGGGDGMEDHTGELWCQVDSVGLSSYHLSSIDGR